MPQVVVEYSSNIAADADIATLVKLIARTIESKGVFQVAAIKVRAIGYEDFVVADDDPRNAFVSINVTVAKGRPEDGKRLTFDAVFEAVKAHLRPVDERWILALSMDVGEFGDRLAYKQNRLHEKFGTKPFAATVS